MLFFQQSKGAPFRLPQDHQLFTCLTQAIAEGNDRRMCSLNEKTSTFYGLSFHRLQSHPLTVFTLGAVMEDPYWQSFMEQAVRLIYFLAESPDQLCSRLLQRSARLLLGQVAEGGEVNRDVGQTQDGSQESNEQGEQGES